MSTTYEFYLQRAQEAALAASQAQLENVRERELRSEKTWRGLANKAQAFAKRRDIIEAEKASARIEAAAATS